MGVIIAFVLLVILVYRKVPAALAAPICGAVMCIFSGLDVMATLQGDFMQAAADFVKSYFLMFLLCSIYGALMDFSGAAYAIGKWLAKMLGARFAIWGVSAAALILTYGGVSCYVIVFAMYPIALVMFREADISRKMIPGAIGAGAFTAANMLPGTPSVANVIPATALGASLQGEALVSVIVSILIYVLSNIYLIWKNKRNHRKEIGFVPTEKIQEIMELNESRETMNPAVAAIPLVVIIVALNIIKWDVCVSMFAGIVVCYVLFWKRLEDKFNPLMVGTQNGINSCMGVAPVVGLGNVAKLTPLFQNGINWVTSMKGSPVIAWFLVCTVMSAICGSGAGGGSLACSMLGEQYLSMGISPEVLSKVCSGGMIFLDSLPWNGAMCVTIAACDLTHKDSYGDLFVITVLINGLGAILTAVLCSMGL